MGVFLEAGEEAADLFRLPKSANGVLPRHSKLVKALMRALHAREHESLVRICEKLRKGDVLKFVAELRWEHEGSEEIRVES